MNTTGYYRTTITFHNGDTTFLFHPFELDLKRAILEGRDNENRHTEIPTHAIRQATPSKRTNYVFNGEHGWGETIKTREA